MKGTRRILTDALLVDMTGFLVDRLECIRRGCNRRVVRTNAGDCLIGYSHRRILSWKWRLISVIHDWSVVKRAVSQEMSVPTWEVA